MKGTIDMQGRTALVTGASSGIGAAFAEALARRGANLVLVARSYDALAARGAQLQSEFDVEVRTIVADLADPDAVRDLGDRLDAHGVTVDVLVNNAGVGLTGELATADPAATIALVELDVAAVVKTTLRFLPGMVARGHGSIINVASTGAFVPTPTMAAYNASKAFVVSFSRSLWAETEGTGVRVLALCPGPTATPMLLGEKPATGREKGPLGLLRTPAQVVETAMEALARRVPSAIDGTTNVVATRVFSMLPERFALRLSRRMIRAAAARRAAVRG